MWDKRHLEKRIQKNTGLSEDLSKYVVEEVIRAIKETIVRGGRIPTFLTSKGIHRCSEHGWLKITCREGPNGEDCRGVRTKRSSYNIREK